MLTHRGLLRAVLSSVPENAVFDSSKPFTSPDIVSRKSSNKGNAFEATMQSMATLSKSVEVLSSRLFTPPPVKSASSISSADLSAEKQQILATKVTEMRFKSLKELQESIQRTRVSCQQAKVDLDAEKIKPDADYEEVSFLKEVLSSQRNTMINLLEMEKDLIAKLRD